MCLAIPARLVEYLDEDRMFGKVELGGVQRRINTLLPVGPDARLRPRRPRVGRPGRRNCSGSRPGYGGGDSCVRARGVGRRGAEAALSDLSRTGSLSHVGPLGSKAPEGAQVIGNGNLWIRVVTMENLKPKDGVVRLPLRPWEIATLRITR